MSNQLFEQYADLVEGARILHIHPQTLRRFLKQGKVPAVVFAGKYLIKRAWLEDFARRYDPRRGRKPALWQGEPDGEEPRERDV